MRFRKLPIVVEAMHFDGNNYPEIRRWMYGDLVSKAPDLWTFEIKTLDGVMQVSAGDWVIKGVKGEFYPCKSDIFEKSYKAVKEKGKDHE